MNVAMQHTIMVCRIPESVGYLPMLSVRAEGLEPASSTGPATSGRARTSAASSRSSWTAATSSRWRRARTTRGCGSSSRPASSTGSPRTPPSTSASGSTAASSPASARSTAASTAPTARWTQSTWTCLAVPREAAREPDPRRGAGGGGRQLGRDQPRQRRRHDAARATGRKHGRLIGLVMKLAGRERTTASSSSARSTAWSRRTPPSSTPTTSGCRCPAPPRTSWRARCRAPTGQASSPGSSSRARSTCSGTTTRVVVDTGRDLRERVDRRRRRDGARVRRGASAASPRAGAAGTLRRLAATARRPASTRRCRRAPAAGPAAPRSRRSCRGRSKSPTRSSVGLERQRRPGAGASPCPRLRGAAPGARG